MESTVGQKCQLYRDRPKNICINRRNGKTVFRYQMPDGSHPVFSHNREETYTAARILNDQFAQNRSEQFIERLHHPRVSKSNPRLGRAIDLFRIRVLHNRQLAEQTRENYEGMLRTFDNAWAITPFKPSRLLICRRT